MIAIDLGSNTIRLIHFECSTQTILFEESIIVKSADGIAVDGNISSSALTRVIEAIKLFQSKIDFHKESVVAVTTQALREAKNSKDVLDAIKRATGVAFQVISGDEEARLTLKAVDFRLNQLGFTKGFMLVDIGGGSTEIILSDGKDFLAKSFPVGIVTLSQKHTSQEAMETYLDDYKNNFMDFIHSAKEKLGDIELFVATAGTPTTLANMKLGRSASEYNAQDINGVSITLDEALVQLEKLLRMNQAQKIQAVGVGREDIITAGVLILKQLYEAGGFRECIVIDDGLREGVALEACEKNCNFKSLCDF
jgi:exopolyphosphatase/guanosine-5'-triphosphate,3'-diphosphate pyrophosphatase